MAEQFDVSPEERKNLVQKAQRRAFLRNEFLKLKSDPFRHATGEGGTVFDPAILRYSAMKVNEYEHFKPNIRNGIYGLAFLVVPMGLYGYFMWKSRNDLENKYRRGEVAYKDRSFKFI